MLLLVLLSVLTGLITALVIRHTADQSALRMVFKRIHAHLLEFRLFFDEPGLLWQAQVALVRENLRLFRLLLAPTLILALPMTWLFVQLETVYGHDPLRPGEPAIVTAQLTRPIEAADGFDLRSTDGIAVETPAVKVLHDNQVSWRIRPSRDFRGALSLTLNGRILAKTIAVGDSPPILSPRRSRSLAAFLLHPEEPRLPPNDLAWIEVAYPESPATWLAWFLALSTLAALFSARLPGNRVN